MFTTANLRRRLSARPEGRSISEPDNHTLCQRIIFLLESCRANGNYPTIDQRRHLVTRRDSYRQTLQQH